MYTGQVLLSKDTIELILSAGEILGMDDLKKECSRFMDDTLNTDNVLLYWRLALHFEEKEIADKCQTRVLRDSKKLNLVVSLASVTEEMMKLILSDDNLEVKSEVEVCEMPVKWLQVQTKTGCEVHPDQLLHLIRWSGISFEYLRSSLLQDTAVTSDPQSMTFMSKVMTNTSSGVQFEGLQTFHRASTDLDNCLMTVGLCDGYTISKEVF